MNFTEISIDDKKLFDSFLDKYNPQQSELTFTNLFMWRKYYGFRYSINNGYLCIISVPDMGEPSALPPIGVLGGEDYEKTIADLNEHFNNNNWRLVFKRVTDRELEHIKGFGERECQIIPDRDNSDYLYLTNDLITLKGKKYDGKRNHINRFKRSYEYEYVNLDSSLLEECEKIIEEWCSGRDCSCQKGEYCEKHANLEVVRNYDSLGCKGALIKVDGHFEAFTIGEKLNSDTAVIHIEKANFKINGLYAIINQQFCQMEWYHTLYINREQDLGQEGLRKSKLSYNPVKMVEKYTLKF